MAKKETTADTPDLVADTRPAPKPSSAFAFAAVMLILTGVGVGFGGLTGLQLWGRMEKAAEAQARPAPNSAAGTGQAVKGRYAAGASLTPLAPIVTNLASPEHTWVRLEALLVTEGEQTADMNALSAQIVEDVVAFLRTVSLTQIQGASGFQHLREDLNDRVRVRSGGKVRDMVVQSLIIE